MHHVLAAWMTTALLLGMPVALHAQGGRDTAVARTTRDTLAACAGDTTVYTVADTALGVRVPQAQGWRGPQSDPTSGDWRIVFVVGADGIVEPRSLETYRDGRAARNRRLEATLRHTRFRAAARAGCAVRFRASFAMGVIAAPTGAAPIVMPSGAMPRRP
jgi:hypothetical protein